MFYLVGDVVDGDVVHGGGVALIQSVQIRPTVSGKQQAHQQENGGI